MMFDFRLSSKRYALGVLNELQQLGYSEIHAKSALLRHYRGLRRYTGSI